MVFNSLEFLYFFAAFFLLYFGLKGKSRQWLILVSSYFFYGWWDYRFLSLIVISTLIDYTVGNAIARASLEKSRKHLLWISLFSNLGILGFFKYFNFFIGSFVELMNQIGLNASYNTLQIILPVGISFYTFQTLSYTLDIYRKQLEPEKSLLIFANFVAFFPQLVAGPIVRAKELIPQFHIPHKFDYQRFISGFRLVLWGLFKKVVVADSIATIVDVAFDRPLTFSSLYLILALSFYAFQIYCDFSGYSDIAIGIARILGFKFPENFRFPYFASSITGFWRRWHISLTTWFRDYLYIPLGGNRGGSFGTYRNMLITFSVSGLWHGAGWNFVVWGFLHGIFMVVERASGYPKLLEKHFKGWKELPFILFNFVLATLAWLFFRAADFGAAMTYLGKILQFDGMSPGTIAFKFIAVKGLFSIALMLLIEILMHRTAFQRLFRKPWVNLMAATACILCIMALGSFGGKSFIYFQF